MAQSRPSSQRAGSINKGISPQRAIRVGFALSTPTDAVRAVRMQFLLARRDSAAPTGQMSIEGRCRDVQPLCHRLHGDVGISQERLGMSNIIRRHRRWTPALPTAGKTGLQSGSSPLSTEDRSNSAMPHSFRRKAPSLRRGRRLEQTSAPLNKDGDQTRLAGWVSRHP
jgi:hypothetical protein